MSGARYFITFIDDFLRNVWFFALKSKGNYFERFIEFKVLEERQLKHKIKAFWSDNSVKFIFKVFEHFLN